MRTFSALLLVLSAWCAHADDTGNFKVIVYNKLNLETVSGAEVKLQDIVTGRTYTQSTGYDGSANFQINKNAKYRLEVSKIAVNSSFSFLTQTYVITEKEISSGKVFDAMLETVKHEQAGLLPAMYFEYNVSTLSHYHVQMLDNLYNMFIGYPSLQVEIGVYADCRERKDITALRARQIINYLETKGDTKKISVKEYGAIHALNQCDCTNEYMVCSEQSYLENRRAEFKIISF